MNKLDALIEACDTPSLTIASASTIRRILEAVREDMNSAISSCDLRRERGDCAPWVERGRDCPGCPATEHSLTREVLEHLE